MRLNRLPLLAATIVSAAACRTDDVTSPLARPQLDAPRNLFAAPNGAYDASLGSLPELQGWTFIDGGGNPAPSVSGGVLRDDAIQGSQWWQEIDTSIDFTKDFVYEVNIHVDSSNYVTACANCTREGFYLDVADQSSQSISIGLTDTAYSVNNFAAIHPLKSHLLADGKFHTLRLEVHSGLASFSIDGVVDTTGLTATSINEPAGRVLFGAEAGVSRSLTELKTVCFSTTVASCDADLALKVLSSIPTNVMVGQTITVNLRDDNAGPVPSTGATLLISKTPGFQLISPTNCVSSPGALACPIGAVPVSGQLPFTLQAKAVKRGTFTVTLTLNGQQHDGNAANNAKTKTITVS